MKKIRLLFFLLSMSVISSISIYGQAIPTNQMYLAQTPPGKTPIIFNLAATPGLRPVERIAITTDGKEIYYGELDTWPPTNCRIKCYKYSDNKWQDPTIVFEGYVAPGLSVNDSILYMQKNVNNIACTFYSIRNNTGWSVPTMLLSANQEAHYLQKTKFNNSYLASSPSGNSDICRLITNNSNTAIRSLGLPMNTSDTENDFFIARDESYIIFIRFGNTTASDMYISYKNNNGTWTNPKKFGTPINTPDPNWECCPYVTNDNKYLFFTRGGNTMNSYSTYWVKIDNIIDSLKRTNFIPYQRNQIPNQLLQVDHSFNYTVPDTTFIDDDGNNTLTFSATLSNEKPLPSWLLFDPSTRTFSGTPEKSASVEVKVTAKDYSNANVSCQFRIDITNVSGVGKSDAELPQDFNLYQNYPNPFNPTTVVEFAIPKSGIYTLSVFNMLGEFVKVIADKGYAAGYHKETFNAEGLSSGTYIYKLMGNNVNIVHKMTILK